MLIPRTAFDAVAGFDEGFPLYAEELDIATRLRDAGWSVLFTPEVEITHAVGVSTGGDRRPHRLVVMHSDSLYRYYARHRAAGWRRVTLPVAWLALRARAEIAWLLGKGDAAMKAVVLVGGEGTRMRPLTETTPKPLIPVVDRPGLDHVLDHLARHGVHEVVLSSPYLERVFHPFIAARHGDPAITWITESEPLGTGGAIVNALPGLGDEPFFALNGDILTDLDLTAMLAFHRERGAAVTIALHHVEDARAFGLVVTDADGRVEEFREKPERPDARRRERRHVPVRPRGAARVDPRPRDLDRARDLPAGDRRGARGVRVPGRTATGWTSAPRRSTCRRTSTCSPGSCAAWTTRRRGSPRPPTSSPERCSARRSSVGAEARVGAGRLGRGQRGPPGRLGRGRRHRADDDRRPGRPRRRQSDGHRLACWGRAPGWPTGSRRDRRQGRHRR